MNSKAQAIHNGSPFCAIMSGQRMFKGQPMEPKKKHLEDNPIHLRTYLDGEIFLIAMLITFWLVMGLGILAVFQIIYHAGFVTFAASLILAGVLVQLWRHLRLQWL
jgi:hypothetical protein